ncbi:unnamed protein product [Rotaria sp. Silwood1]|nr:unnamed protein product [Rotaria sp. Silwood1]
MLYQSTLIRHLSTTCPFTMTRYLIVIADFLVANTIDQLLEHHNQTISSELDKRAVEHLLEYIFVNALTFIIYKSISDPDVKSKHNGIVLALIGILLAIYILAYNQINH